MAVIFTTSRTWQRQESDLPDEQSEACCLTCVAIGRAAFSGTSADVWELMNGMSDEEMTAYDPHGNTVRLPSRKLVSSPCRLIVFQLYPHLMHTDQDTRMMFPGFD